MIKNFNVIVSLAQVNLKIFRILSCRVNDRGVLSEFRIRIEFSTLSEPAGSPSFPGEHFLLTWKGSF
jgi:hypothetical protein